MFNLILINAFLFIFSVIGLIFARHNFILILVSLEIGFLAISLIYTITSFIIDDLYGQLFTIFILTIAGGESALAISFLVFLDRYNVALNAESVTYLKGLFFIKNVFNNSFVTLFCLPNFFFYNLFFLSFE
jgi:NADH-quinone oxidoreductase subunit K